MGDDETSKYSEADLKIVYSLSRRSAGLRSKIEELSNIEPYSGDEEIGLRLGKLSEIYSSIQEILEPMKNYPSVFERDIEVYNGISSDLQKKLKPLMEDVASLPSLIEREVMEEEYLEFNLSQPSFLEESILKEDSIDESLERGWERDPDREEMAAMNPACGSEEAHLFE